MASEQHTKASTILPFSIDTSSEDATRAAAATFAATLKPGDVVALTGPLGAGKTCFARAIIGAMLGSADVFQGSPTFALVQEYAGIPLSVYHFDFYRIKRAQEIYEFGWLEYTSRRQVCLVEWADKFPEVLPAHTIWLKFSLTSDTQRRIETIMAPESAA